MSNSFIIVISLNSPSFNFKVLPTTTSGPPHQDIKVWYYSFFALSRVIECHTQSSSLSGGNEAIMKFTGRGR